MPLSDFSVQGFHAEREARGLMGSGAARAPQHPPTQLAGGGFNMMHAALGRGVAIAPPPRMGPQVWFLVCQTVRQMMSDTQTDDVGQPDI